jgi:hypothetical protein
MKKIESFFLPWTVRQQSHNNFISEIKEVQKNCTKRRQGDLPMYNTKGVS